MTKIIINFIMKFKCLVMIFSSIEINSFINFIKICFILVGKIIFLVVTVFIITAIKMN